MYVKLISQSPIAPEENITCLQITDETVTAGTADCGKRILSHRLAQMWVQ